MIVRPLAIPDVVLLEPKIFRDHRGSFFESFNLAQLETALGRSLCFVQDNHSASNQNVLRGLHYQIKQPQGKLIKVTRGEIFDVVVDMRQHSNTFGQSVCQNLSQEMHNQLWIPEGFAHGFLTLSDVAEVLYKTTDYYAPEHERCLRWDDSTLNIPWPLKLEQESISVSVPILSIKDAQGVSFEEAETYV
jgi:dTDP-4-dehydrorhamnose 3,5-epimerase